MAFIFGFGVGFHVIFNGILFSSRNFVKLDLSLLSKLLSLITCSNFSLITLTYYLLMAARFAA